MKMNNHVLCLLLILLMAFSISCQKPQAEFNEELDLSGGWNYEIYLTKATEFANTLLEKGKDNYGPKKTPMFLSLLDIKTGQRASSLASNPTGEDDPGDFGRNVNESNLSCDFTTLSGLFHLSNVTQNPKYRDAANDYLKYFLNHCVSETTGLFGYGEGMYYDVERDTVINFRHELGPSIPLLSEMWKREPGIMHRYTEAIRKYHIYDSKHFFYHRQANYYTGEFADSSAPGTWIRHAGLFANVFMAAFSQTQDRKFLNWSRKISGLPGKQSNPQTALVRDNLLDETASACRQNPLFSWYLLNTTPFFEDEMVLVTAMAFIRAFSEFAYNPADQSFFAELQIADGKPASEERQAIWEDDGPAIISARACILAFNKSQEKFFLDRSLKYATYIRNNPPTRTTPPGNVGNAIQFFLDMYETNKSSVFLNEARKLAQYAIPNYFENGLIKSSPDGGLYSARTLPGELFSALVRLYEIELNLDFHWKAPRVVKTGSSAIPFEIKMKSPTALAMDYSFGTGNVRTMELAFSKKTSTSFEVPIDDPGFDGVFYFYFYNPDKSLMSESGEIAIDDDLVGPEIQNVKIENMNSATASAVVRAYITDPKGVKNAILKYGTGKHAKSITPESADGGEYVFRIALPITGDSLGFFIEAEDNDNIPAKAASPQFFLHQENEKSTVPQAHSAKIRPAIEASH